MCVCWTRLLQLHSCDLVKTDAGVVYGQLNSCPMQQIIRVNVRAHPCIACAATLVQSDGAQRLA